MAISLSQLTRANQPKPPRITIHGVAGVGKTTFAAQAYKPVFIQTEDGLGTLSANHFPLARTFEEVLDALAALYTEEHDFKTVVIDSVDRLYLIGIRANYEEDGTEVTLGSLFPGYDSRVFANWYSGVLSIPQGDLVEYVHMGYASVYERDLLISVDQGVIVDTQVRVNGEPSAAKESRV